MNDLAKQGSAIAVKGKKYTQVKDRVVIWRRHFGFEQGVESEVLRDDGTTVQVRCIIRDTAGMVIGSGLAEEIRGSTNVNKTSALENCETSALGRALASIGLHGGEYASANEMDKVERMTAMPVPEPTIVENIEDTIEIDNVSWVDEAIAGFAKHRHMGEHALWTTVNEDALQALNERDYNRLIKAWKDRRQYLMNGAE
jgi:hypothetical protein